jgi:tetratricopeptide (TPR) repeat protein
MAGLSLGDLAAMLEQPGLYGITPRPRALRRDDRDEWEGVVADTFAKRVAPEWEEHKNRGNAALKAGDHAGAIAAYSDALVIARGRDPQLDEVLATLKGCPADSASARAMLGGMALAQLIGRFLPSLGEVTWRGGVLKGREPNKPAAVCLANRALVHFQCGRLEESLADAEAATLELPEYVKAHHRVAKVRGALAKRAREQLQALLSSGTATGDVGAQSGKLRAEAKAHAQAAKEKQEEMKVYENGCRLPYHGAALVGAGWVDVNCDLLVYQQTRFSHICAQIRGPGVPEWHESTGNSGAASMTVGSSSCSLVNFAGRQWLMMGITCRFVVKCLKLLLVDAENGNELDGPPHGHPTAKARKAVPQLLVHFVQDVKTAARVHVGMLQLGQGLTEMVEVVQAAMGEAGLGDLRIVRAHAALGTGAAHTAHLQQAGLAT